MKVAPVALLFMLASCDDGCCGTINVKQDSTLRMPVDVTTAFATVDLFDGFKKFSLSMSRYAADCGAGSECEFYYYVDAADDLRIQGNSILDAAYRAAPTSEINVDVTKYQLPFDVELVRAKHVIARFHFEPASLTYVIPTTVTAPGELKIGWAAPDAVSPAGLDARLTTCDADVANRSKSHLYRRLSVASLSAVLPIVVPAACEQPAITLQLDYAVNGTVEGFVPEISSGITNARETRNIAIER